MSYEGDFGTNCGITIFALLVDESDGLSPRDLFSRELVYHYWFEVWKLAFAMAHLLMIAKSGRGKKSRERRVWCWGGERVMLS